MRFEGKCVVILGGNAGIGLAAARMFRAEGAKLAITGRDTASLTATAAELDALAIRSDMGVIADSQAAMAEIAERLGGIDVLFVNAGVGGFAPIPEVTEEFWDGIHSVNLRGAFFAIQAALPHIRDGGSIVITGSIGSIAAVPGNVAYAAAKAGLRAVARILGVELLPRKIRVNMVSPVVRRRPDEAHGRSGGGRPRRAVSGECGGEFHQRGGFVRRWRVCGVVGEVEKGAQTASVLIIPTEPILRSELR
jgi:NAD(P)-dependent dehydrogenase (short-subunit alcohol dehydrogenase family)